MRPGESWEDAARQQRKVAFSAALQRHPGFIFTAHHADDLAETVLWRLLTGNVASQAGGIQVIFKNEVRPLLQARRHHLREYLGEEGIGWREDSTNSEGRFLRSKMRVQLMPELTRLFPRGVDHLVRWALEEQGVLPRHQPPDGGDADEALGHLALIRLAGVRARRSHWEAIEQKAVSKNWTGELLLPGGWRIRKESLNQDRSERWILEKSSSE